MKMQKVIDVVSKEYRSHLNELSHLRKEHALTVQLIANAKAQRGENLTHGEYLRLENSQQRLETQIRELEDFCNGFSAAREVLMDLGFDTEVEV